MQDFICDTATQEYNRKICHEIYLKSHGMNPNGSAKLDKEKSTLEILVMNSKK